jgi:hypothetical protein
MGDRCAARECILLAAFYAAATTACARPNLRARNIIRSFAYQFRFEIPSSYRTGILIHVRAEKTENVKDLSKFISRNIFYFTYIYIWLSVSYIQEFWRH